jgi:hypothetical protein
LTLKHEIDSLVEQKNEVGISSEESSSHDWDISPRQREKNKVEKKYKKKMLKVMDTFVDRVENQSSSGGSSSSSDEKFGNK